MGLISGLLGHAGVVSADKIKEEYGNLLTEEEEIDIGFKLIRDMFIFTNFRLILVNKQGLTAKKVDYMSIRYKAISRFSIETAGHFDLDAELKIWIAGESEPAIEKQFNRQVNIYDLQKILANRVLKS